jgi:hypothetical protein
MLIIEDRLNNNTLKKYIIKSENHLNNNIIHLTNIVITIN